MGFSRLILLTGLLVFQPVDSVAIEASTSEEGVTDPLEEKLCLSDGTSKVCSRPFYDEFGNMRLLRILINEGFVKLDSLPKDGFKAELLASRNRMNGCGAVADKVTQLLENVSELQNKYKKSCSVYTKFRTAIHSEAP